MFFCVRIPRFQVPLLPVPSLVPGDEKGRTPGTRLLRVKLAIFTRKLILPIVNVKESFKSKTQLSAVQVVLLRISLNTEKNVLHALPCPPISASQ